MNRKIVLILIIVLTFLAVGLIIVFNPSAKYNKLSVSEAIWNNLKTTRKESENIKIDDIEFNGYNLIIDETTNSLFYSLVNDSKNKYNPSVRFKSSTSNAKIAILLDEITDEKVRSNYKFNIMIYNDKEYHVYNLICTDLPLINIQSEINKSNNQKRTQMKIYIFNNLSNTPNKITMSDGKFKSIGNSFVFSLSKITPGKNKRENKISILNMKPNSEYVLNPVDRVEDNNINIDKPKGQRIELFINNSYIGTYSLEHNQEKGKFE